MGSMGGFMSKHTRPEMFKTLNSKVDDKIKDHTQYVAEDDNGCSVDKFASVKNLKQTGSSSDVHVPRRPRTPRFCVGILTYNSESFEYYHGSQVIIDENNSRKSKKRSRDNDSEEDQSPKKKKKKKKDYIVPDDDYDEEEEGSKKKRRNSKIQKKTAGLRKAVKVYDLPVELPQNLQEYISGLNLEVPPLFVAQKLLTVSDITSNQGRLLLPKSLINTEFLDNFLTKVEKEMLEQMEAVEVNLVDDKLREFNDLRLATWKMTSSVEYVLRRAWNMVVVENKLESVKVSKDSKNKIVVMKDDDLWKTDVVAMVWCFRRDSKIWLALHTQAMTELDILGVKEDDNGERYIIE